MDTKTRKQEALALLAKDETTVEQDKRLHYLTAKAAGLPTHQEYVYNSRYDRYDLAGGEEPQHYSYSVDAALTLISEYRYVIRHLMGSFRVTLYRDSGDSQGTFADAWALQIAILKAFWQLQPD
jgi:hypothetical protein